MQRYTQQEREDLDHFPAVMYNKKTTLDYAFSAITDVENYVYHFGKGMAMSVKDAVVGTAEVVGKTAYHFLYTYPESYIQQYNAAVNAHDETKMKAALKNLRIFYTSNILGAPSFNEEDVTPGLIRAAFADNDLTWQKKSAEMQKIFTNLPRTLEYLVHNPVEVKNRIVNSFYSVVNDPEKTGNVAGNIFLLATAPESIMNFATKQLTLLNKASLLGEEVMKFSKIRIGPTLPPHLAGEILESGEHINVPHATHAEIKSNVTNEALKTFDFEENIQYLVKEFRSPIANMSWAELLRKFHGTFLDFIEKYAPRTRRRDLNSLISEKVQQLTPRTYESWELRAAAKFKLKYPAFRALSDEEIVSIYIYTTEEYVGINASLRESETVNGIAQTQKYHQVIRDIRTGLKKLPRLQDGRILFRASGWYGTEGGVLVDKAFMSATFDRDVAIEFGRKLKTEKKYLLEIHDAVGYDVSALSRMPDEKEILMMDGTQLQEFESIDLKDESKEMEEFLNSNPAYKEARDKGYHYIKRLKVIPK